MTGRAVSGALAVLALALLIAVAACGTVSARGHDAHQRATGAGNAHARRTGSAAGHRRPASPSGPKRDLGGGARARTACGVLTAQQVSAILGAPAQGRKPGSAAPGQELCTYGLGPSKTAAGLKFRTVFVAELQCGKAAAQAWPYYLHHGASVGRGVWTADRAGGDNAGVRLGDGCVLSATAAFASTGEAVPGSREAMYRVLAEVGSHT